LLKQYSLGDASTPSVDKLLAERDHFLEQTKVRLLQSQDYYKKHYDRKYTDRTFQIGDWVYLKLMARTAFGISHLRKGKLAPKFFGPFQISDRIGSVAYRLNLPEEARINNAFHISMLKPHKGLPPAKPGELPTMDDGVALPESESMLKAWAKDNKIEVPIKWKDQPAADSSWEGLDYFRQLYPKFQLEDKLILQAGRDVTVVKRPRGRPRKVALG
jgi:hypothetical protein